RDAGGPACAGAGGAGVAVSELERLSVPANLDEEALEDLATTTGGRLYDAESAGELKDVYSDTASSLGTETVHEEVVVHFVAAGLVLAAAAAAFSLAWSQRLP